MDKKELYQKWINNDLNNHEKELFKSVDEYKDLIKLDKGLQYFKAPEYNLNKEFESLNRNIFTEKRNDYNSSWKFTAFKIAAIFLIGFFAIKFGINSSDKQYNTAIAQKTELDLPDASKVMLNAVSVINYDSKKWENNRKLTLKGEAYFKVEKGEKFTVSTDLGEVSVLGTQFNVSTRNDILNVKCFEGAVKVTSRGKSYILKQNDQIVVNKKNVDLLKHGENHPLWISNKSKFNSEKLEYVFEEFKRQYSIESIKFEDNIDKEILFSGIFTHSDIDKALKSITLPLKLNYKLDNKKILIFKD